MSTQNFSQASQRRRTAVAALATGLSASVFAPLARAQVGLAVGGSTAAQAAMKALGALLLTSDAYSGSGSSGGLQALTAGTLDIAVTDWPLTQVTLQSNGWKQVPLFADALAVAVNLPGVADIRLSADVLADMYMGNLREWQRGTAQAMNPSLKLPALPVLPVGRSDGSASSMGFLTYLSRGNRQFSRSVGADFVGRFGSHVLTARGTAGVLEQIRTKPGAVGYAGAAEARRAGLTLATLLNLAGQAVVASTTAVTAMLDGSEWDSATGAADIERSRAPAGWPLTQVVYAVYAAKGGRSASAKEFLQQALQRGTPEITRLGFVPLPEKGRAAAARALA